MQPYYWPVYGMQSDMMIIELLLPFAFLFSQLSSSFGNREAPVDEAKIVPSISIGTCSPLINGKSFAICGKAYFLDGALVRLYGPNGIFLSYNPPNNFVSNNSLFLACRNETIGDITISCSRTEFETLYLVNFSSFDQTRHLGDWSCETYIDSANMTLTSREVITRNDGLVKTQVNQAVELLWNITRNYVVMSPSNEVLVNVSGDVLCNKSDHVDLVRKNATGKTGIRLNNTSGSDAGMYVFQTSNGVRAALSLQVQDKPTKPRVIYRNLHIEGYPKVASAILYCLSDSQSKGPMMNEQTVVYRWNGLNSQDGLHVESYGSGLKVGNVDCTKVTSYPISCHAEHYGLKSDTTWIIPQLMCLMSGSDYYSPTTSAPDDGFYLGVTIPFLLLGCVALSISIWHLCRQCARPRCVRCRGICVRPCHRRCCQATRNGFAVGFQAVRRCFNAAVTFIQNWYLRRSERNRNENVRFDGVAVHIGEQNAVNQRAESYANHQPADGTEDGAMGCAEASASPTEAERRVQYQTEVTFNLNDLHSMLKHPPMMMRVRRNRIVTDLLRLFEDPSVGKHLISTKFIDEDGVDGGGVTRDLLTIFWNEVKETYFLGNEAFVPHLRPERLSDRKNFLTLGRILSHSTAMLRSIPIQICRSTLMVIIYDTCDINPDTLLEDFLLFLDSEDRVLVNSSLCNFESLREEDIEKLQELFMKFGMGIIPKAATLRQHVVNLAQNELCIKPKFFCENMRNGIPRKHMKHFWMHMTLQHLEYLYENFVITAENVWSKIQCENRQLQNPNERRVYGYLRDLIQDLPPETLLSFVQFITAERKIPSSFITVGFIDTRGIARCPIASTCAYRLDIPVSYTSFEEFKTEFMMVLNSDEAKTFSRK